MPVKYVPFVPEPVKGQAVLQNFNRVLRYKGADDTAEFWREGCRCTKWKSKKQQERTKAAILSSAASVFLPAPICRSRAYRRIWSI